MSGRRLLLRFAVTVLVALALAGHVVYHYLPRARPASPEAGSRVAALLASEDLPVALWMPYPHQNLGFLRRSLGRGGRGLRAVGRLAGLPAPALPAFGPLPVPPASEMAVASDESGERYAVLAEVYPAFALFARLAGRLANNPWLAGGEVYVEGRRAEVLWRGNTWVVTSPDSASELLAGLEAGLGGELPAPALAVLRMRQAVHPLPAGRYRLVAEGGALEITSAAAPAAAFEPLGLSEVGSFLFIFGGRVVALGEPSQALVFFVSGGGGGAVELPRAAVLHPPGSERWSLPGESLLELGGRRPRQGEAAGWSIAALDQSSLEAAGLLAPRFGEWVAAGDEPPAWALWLDLGAGLAEVSRIADILDGLPIVPRRQVERWRDAAAVLTPLAAGYSRLTVVVHGEPRAFRLRLEPRAESSDR